MGMFAFNRMRRLNQVAQSVQDKEELANGSESTTTHRTAHAATDGATHAATDGATHAANSADVHPKRRRKPNAIDGAE